MIKKGQILYDLWTVSGNIYLTIEYIIEWKGNGVGNLIISGEGKPEKLDDDTIDEIIQRCLEDAKEREEKEDYRQFKRFDFGKN